MARRNPCQGEPGAPGASRRGPWPASCVRSPRGRVEGPRDHRRRRSGSAPGAPKKRPGATAVHVSAKRLSTKGPASSVPGAVERRGWSGSAPREARTAPAAPRGIASTAARFVSMMARCPRGETIEVSEGDDRDPVRGHRAPDVDDVPRAPDRAGELRARDRPSAAQRGESVGLPRGWTSRRAVRGSAAGSGRSSSTVSRYTSSTSTVKPRASARFARRARLSGEATTPDGLWGFDSITRRVAGVSAAATASGSRAYPSSKRRLERGRRAPRAAWRRPAAGRSRASRPGHRRPGERIAAQARKVAPEQPPAVATRSAATP